MGLPWSLICDIIAIATSSSFFPIARPTLSLVSISMAIPRQKLPRSASSGCPLFPLCDLHKSTWHLAEHGSEDSFQKQRLDLFNMISSFEKPIHNSFLFDSFDS